MNGHDQSAINEFCQGLYRDTEDFLSRIGLSPKLRFKILNGPPLRNADILFIGYQPGGRERDAAAEIKKGTDKGWPEECEYAHETWRLAPIMQKVFGRDRLRGCVGTNAIFLRYPNAKEYRLDVGVKQQEIEAFCAEKVMSIVRAIEPKNIVTIGFKTLDLLGASTQTVAQRDNGRGALIKLGKIGDYAAVGMIHLTGARGITNCEIQRLNQHFSN